MTVESARTAMSMMSNQFIRIPLYHKGSGDAYATKKA